MKKEKWVLKFIEREDFRKSCCFLKIASRPEWDCDDKCRYCSKKFTVFWRRHHCRRCGKTICSSCSEYLEEIP